MTSKLAIYKVREKNGTYAGKGLRFGHPKGKTWVSKTALKLAFSSQFLRCTYAERAIPEWRKQALEKLFNHAEENGWAIYELSDTGARWLTVREFYGE